MTPQLSLTRRTYELMSSMRFAVSLLVIIGIASIVGTVLKQNEPYSNYIIQFGQFWFGLFEMLGLFDVYHSPWFLLILLFLVISTSLCIYRNTPIMLRELRAFRESITEKSLRSFSHQAEYVSVHESADTKQHLLSFLTVRGFRYKIQSQADGKELIAAKAGSYQRLGYIFTHAAIVVICIGGLIDGNVPFKLQELLGNKKIETRDIPETQVAPESRLGVSNLSFRANMTLPEGASSDVAFMRMRDGYLVQELPFRIALKDFRIEHYATGQPKSFESDLVIIDPDLDKPMERTIKVNHPLIYKGIAIYQSDFQDGGSRLNMNVWNIFGASPQPISLAGNVFKDATLGGGNEPLKIEFTDFRLFNILNLSADGKGKPHNVGPSILFKVRDSQGQAREYLNYMNPVLLREHMYFISGMREMQQDDYKYLRIPVDANGGLEGFMGLRAVMFDQAAYPVIAKRFADAALDGQNDRDVRQKFEISVIQLLKTFAQGGYVKIADMIEQSVPEAEREKAVQAYVKIVSGAAYEAYRLSLERAGEKTMPGDEAFTDAFLQDSLNAMSDLFFYGAPFYLQLKDFEHREASGLQLTRSPGKNLVYSGSVLLVLGIFAMIYIRERRIWLLLNPTTNQILFAMSSNRKNRDFDQEFARYNVELQQLLTNERQSNIA